MSKDKYPSIFSRQMEAIVFIILQIFFATGAELKIGEYSRTFPSIQSREAFRPIARERKYLMDYKTYSNNISDIKLNSWKAEKKYTGFSASSTCASPQYAGIINRIKRWPSLHGNKKRNSKLFVSIMMIYATCEISTPSVMKLQAHINLISDLTKAGQTRLVENTTVI